MKFGRKQFVILAAVAVICVSVYLNWRFNSGEAVAQDVIDAGRSLGQAQLVSADGALLPVDTASTLPGGLAPDVPANIDVDPVLPDDTVDGTDALAQSSYFSEVRIERQQSRDEAVEILKEIAGNVDNSQEVRNKAAQDMGIIALNIERERNIETVIKSKGFEDCVAVLSENSIYLVVKTPGLLNHEVAQIREVVMGETGFGADKIKIVEVK